MIFQVFSNSMIFRCMELFFSDFPACGNLVCLFVWFDSLRPITGWVVTWFLLGYTVRMFEYTVRTFWSNVWRFLYVFSSITRKSYTIFQPTFSPIKRYQDSIFKLLTLSTNSVTNVVRTAYFQIQARSSPLKNLWQSLYSKYEALWGYPGSIRSGKMGAGKWCITFCVKMKKTRRNIYLLLLKTSVWKEVRHFSVQCILTETMWLPTLINNLSVI